MMHASPRLLMLMFIVVSLAGCGPTTSAPTRTAATAASLGSAATSRARATVLPQTVAPTGGGVVATTPSASPASAVVPTIGPQSTTPPSVMAVTLPDGRGGVGFDDLRYDATLGQVLAPGGRTGKVDLVDPSTQAVTPIAGFSAQPRFSGGHDDGPTSADAGHGLIFVTDRTTRRLSVVDPETRAIVASVALESSPDYVRYVAPTGELWVTEPDQEQIEVFTLPDTQKPMPERAAVIVVKGGPESLVIDPQRQRAFTHLWVGATVAIDLNNRTLVAQW